MRSIALCEGEQPFATHSLGPRDTASTLRIRAVGVVYDSPEEKKWATRGIVQAGKSPR